MQATLIVGTSRGAAAALAGELRYRHRLWTASRTAPDAATGKQIVWDATADHFPACTSRIVSTACSSVRGPSAYGPSSAVLNRSSRKAGVGSLMGAVRAPKTALRRFT